MRRSTTNRDEQRGDERRSRDRDGQRRSDRGERRDERGSARQDPVGDVHAVAGNQAVKDAHDREEIQPKLTVSQPDDPAEREAERVAAAVLRATGPAAVDRPAPESASRASASRDETGGETGSESSLEDRIDALGNGRALSTSTRSFFESRFGRDFSTVRVHTGPQADEAARSIDAEAFTRGSDVVFANDQYQPETTAGKQLLAHELAHVVQQGADGGPLQESATETTDGTTERADAGTRGQAGTAQPARRGGTRGDVVDRQAASQRSGGKQRTQQSGGGQSTQQTRSSGSNKKKGWEGVPKWFREAVAQAETPFSSNDIMAPAEYGWDSGKQTEDGFVVEGGRLFIEGPGDDAAAAPDDPQQVKLGNCYVLATLKAVAQHRPELVKDLITPVSDGFEVTLYPGASGEKRIFVSDTFVFPEGSFPSSEEAIQSGDPEVWVNVIEKAWAKELGGDDSDVSADTEDSQRPEIIRKLMDNSEGANTERWERLNRALGGDATQEVELGELPFGSRAKNAAAAHSIVEGALDNGTPVTAHVSPRGNADMWTYPLATADHAYNVKDARGGKFLLDDPLASEAIQAKNKARENTAEEESWPWEDPQVVRRQEETWIPAAELAELYNVRFYVAKST